MAIIKGVFSATGQSPVFTPLNSYFDALIHAASWTGNSVQLERQFPNDATWYVLSEDAAGTPAIYTTQDFNGVILEPIPNVLYRWNCTLWASTMNYRFQ